MPVLVRIEEFRSKNQAPRRVLAAWTGWFTGAPFHEERPELGARTKRAVEVVALLFGCAMGVFALGLGWRFLRDPDSPQFACAFAIAMLLPVRTTRYVWPTHYTAALPLVAIAWTKAGGRRIAGTGALLFLAGTACYYVAHIAEPLEFIGAAGPLLLGCLSLLLAFRNPVTGSFAATPAVG